MNTKPLNILSANLVQALSHHNIWIKDFGLDGYNFRNTVSRIS
ncbi:MAG: hypothetical protein O4859_06395 [Trichodesmium sp. St18_bin1]|nr:hypothetical protein [Trichodesmium sp. St18_bin1]